MDMNLLSGVMIGFVILETSNVAALYFFPDSKMANSMGVFKAWEKSKADPEVHDMVRYLVNWVAGTKLIFILLLTVLLARADAESLTLAGIALVLSISTFFWRLFPLIKKMDRNDQISPKNYSNILGWMILGMIVIFLAALLFAIIN